MPVFSQLRLNLKRRPMWMNLIMVFCFYMAVFYVPWDLFFKPVSEDQEVWFGILLTGWWAKATEPLHLAIYAAGAWGFWHMRAWLHPWAALYVFQIAIGMFIWNLINENGAGFVGAIITATPFIVLGVCLWRARNQFINSQLHGEEAANEPTIG